jgi:hypothetical protein
MMKSMTSVWVVFALACAALTVSVPASAQQSPDSAWSRVKEIDRGKEIRLIVSGSLPVARLQDRLSQLMR